MIRKAIIVVLTLGAVGTGILWIVSYQRPFYGWRGATTSWLGRMSYVLMFHSGRAHIDFFLADREQYRGPLPTDEGGRPLRPHDFQWADLGVIINHVSDPSVGIRNIEVCIPIWLPFMLFAVYPTLAFIRGPLRRHRRRKHGLCIKCGYDLTRLPEPRCPECGEPI